MGSYEYLRLYFENAQNDSAGGFFLKFLSTPQYYLSRCGGWYNFPTTLPSTTEKIWRITLDKSEGIRVIIHCNGMEVLNFLLSDETCTHYHYRSYWSRDVTQLYFSWSDIASDFYRPYTGN